MFLEKNYRMKILGIHLGHNSSFSLIEDGIVKSVFETERFFRIKGHKVHATSLKSKWYKASYQYVHIDQLKEVIRYCISLWGSDYDYIGVENQGRKLEFRNLKIILKELNVKYKDIEIVNHHLSHACGSFFTSKFKKALILSYDGKGNDGKTILFHGERNKVLYLKKIDIALGRAYDNMGYILNVRPEITNATSGKIMGFAGYGKIREEWIPHIKKYILNYKIPSAKPVKGLNSYGRGRRISSDYLNNIEEFKISKIPTPSWVSAGLKILNKINSKNITLIPNKKVYMPDDDLLDIIEVEPIINKYKRSFWNSIKSFIFYIFNFQKIYNFFENKKGYLKFNSIQNKLVQDLMRTFQEVWTNMVLEILHKYMPNYEKLCITGGCALNGITNYHILQKFGWQNVHFIPNPSDCGNSIGAALKVYWERSGNEFKGYNSNFSPYLGMELFDREKFESYQKKFPNQKIPKNKYVKVIAKLLQDGKIIGLIQGKSEIGPRALGNRSIFCNPSIKNMRDIINNKVKNREWFRPFAPISTYEDAEKYFTSEGEIEYMSVICYTRKEFRKLLPSITHVDGSARLQTITREKNPFVYDLIKEFEKLSGFPILLNTSLNPRGEPIINYLKVGLEMIENTGLDYIAYNNVIFGKNKNLKYINNILNSFR